MNTDSFDEIGTHWWNLLDLQPQNQIFFFDSFCFMRFKTFIIQDNKKIINKILFEIRSFNKKDNTITLISLTPFTKNSPKAPSPPFPSTSKSPTKLKVIYSWNFTHGIMYPLSPLFVCFRIWFVSRDVIMTSILWPPPANYVN